MTQCLWTSTLPTTWHKGQHHLNQPNTMSYVCTHTCSPIASSNWSRVMFRTSPSNWGTTITLERSIVSSNTGVSSWLMTILMAGGVRQGRSTNSAVYKSNAEQSTVSQGSVVSAVHVKNSALAAISSNTEHVVFLPSAVGKYHIHKQLEAQSV